MTEKEKEHTKMIESQTQTEDINIPVTFLRSQNETTLLSDEILARNLQIQENLACLSPQQPLPIIGKLDITVCQATLTKAHSPLSIPFIRMDPYVKIILGSFLFETATDYNGSTNPAWNQTLFCNLPQKIDTMQIEVYDERSFSQDEKIAWASVDLPNGLYDSAIGGMEDNWYELKSRNNEPAGKIRIILNFIPSAVLNGPQPSNVPVTTTQSTGTHISDSSSLFPIPNTPLITQQAQQLPATLTPSLTAEEIENQINKFQEMFPNLERQVINTVFESNFFDGDRTVNALLALTETV